jgi:hypothetical protein
MRKLSLNLDEIQVEAFVTGQVSERTGTVRGRDGAGATLNQSCHVTCADTCGGCPFPSELCG